MCTPIQYMLPWTHRSPHPKWPGSVQPFLHSSRQSVPMLYNGLPVFPSKLHLRVGDLDSHLIRGSFGPPKSTTQTVSRSVHLFLRGSRVWQTDRPTDRPHYFICKIGYICVVLRVCDVASSVAKSDSDWVPLNIQYNIMRQCPSSSYWCVMATLQAR